MKPNMYASVCLKVRSMITCTYIPPISPIYYSLMASSGVTGLKESPLMTLADSELLATIMEEVRKQLGVRFQQDKP